MLKDYFHNFLTLHIDSNKNSLMVDTKLLESLMKYKKKEVLLQLCRMRN